MFVKKGTLIKYDKGKYILYVDGKCICESNNMDIIIEEHKKYNNKDNKNITTVSTEVW